MWNCVWFMWIVLKPDLNRLNLILFTGLNLIHRIRKDVECVITTSKATGKLSEVFLELFISFSLNIGIILWSLIRFEAGYRVLAKCPKSDKGQRVAHIRSIFEVKGKLEFEVNWYYWPHETAGGNQPFYAQKEIFSTYDGDVITADDILDRCIVRRFIDYANYPIGPEDYLCRFTYDLSTGYLQPSRVPVYISSLCCYLFCCLLSFFFSF